jgi:FtsP/CotA-like multicopper oxidase with cupredoxin domain
MRFPFHHLAVLAACVGMGLAAVPQPPRVHANDNRTPAGIRRGDTALVELDVVIGRWYPEADDGPSVDVAVFAVRGEPPQVPGPLIRVPAGTTLDVQVRNTLADSAVTLHGFVSHPSAGDSVRLAPGAVRRLQFNVGTPGTYLYWATLGSRYFTFQGA